MSMLHKLSLLQTDFWWMGSKNLSMETGKFVCGNYMGGDEVASDGDITGLD